jgi:hypothetical protein
MTKTRVIAIGHDHQKTIGETDTTVKGEDPATMTTMAPISK